MHCDNNNDFVILFNKAKNVKKKNKFKSHTTFTQTHTKRNEWEKEKKKWYSVCCTKTDLPSNETNKHERQGAQKSEAIVISNKEE